MQPVDVVAHPSRVAVVGTGNVGATFAFALVMSGALRRSADVLRGTIAALEPVESVR